MLNNLELCREFGTTKKHLQNNSEDLLMNTQNYLHKQTLPLTTLKTEPLHYLVGCVHISVPVGHC